MSALTANVPIWQAQNSFIYLFSKYGGACNGLDTTPVLRTVVNPSGWCYFRILGLSESQYKQVEMTVASDCPQANRGTVRAQFLYLWDSRSHLRALRSSQVAQVVWTLNFYFSQELASSSLSRSYTASPLKPTVKKRQDSRVTQVP